MNNIYDILVYNGSSSKDFLTIFFNCYLAVPGSLLGLSRGSCLTNPMLITAFSTNLTQRSPGSPGAS